MPLDQRARQFPRRIVGRVGAGVEQLGVSLVVVVFSLFALSVAGRLPLPASAPASAPGLGCVSFGWWGRPCAWGAPRELGCVAVAVAVTAHGVAGGSLSFSRLGLAAGAGFVWVLPRFFFAVGANPGRPGSVRLVFGYVGWCSVAKPRYKNGR